jgi:hypothetical protein
MHAKTGTCATTGARTTRGRALVAETISRYTLPHASSEGNPSPLPIAVPGGEARKRQEPREEGVASVPTPPTHPPSPCPAAWRSLAPPPPPGHRVTAARGTVPRCRCWTWRPWSRKSRLAHPPQQQPCPQSPPPPAGAGGSGMSRGPRVTRGRRCAGGGRSWRARRARLPLAIHSSISPHHDGTPPSLSRFRGPNGATPRAGA